MLTPAGLGWAAGFLEGEGTFYLRRGSKGHRAGYPVVTATQVQRAPLDRLALYFGGKVYLRVRVPKSGFSDRSIFVWELTGPKAIAVMLTVYVFMTPARRAQIQRCVSHWRSLPGKGVHHREKTHCPKGHPYDAANTIIGTTPHGTFRSRQCRTCQKQWWIDNKGRYTREARRLRQSKLEPPS